MGELMKLDHVMIDIETLATTEDAAILSIGACRFHPDGEVNRAGFYRVLDLATQQIGTGHGRRINADTLYWWMKQNEIARKAVFCSESGSRIHIDNCLGELTQWIAQGQGQYMWSHGSNFDLPILAHAYRTRAMLLPWSYRNTRDTRTLFWLAREMGAPAPDKTRPSEKHHALGDAIRQAEWVIQATQFIKVGK